MPDEDGNAPEGQAPDAASQQIAADAAAAAAAAQGTGTGTEGQAPKDAEKVEDLPQWAQDRIKNLGTEAASHRVAKTNAEKVAAQKVATDIGKILGLVKDDDKKVDPDKVLADLAAEQENSKASQRELAVFKSAPQGVDVQALLDSRSFLASIKDVDPSDKVAVTKAITDAVAANPKFKTETVAPKSGGDLGGGSGEGKAKASSLSGAIGQHYSNKT